MCFWQVRQEVGRHFSWIVLWGTVTSMLSESRSQLLLVLPRHISVVWRSTLGVDSVCATHSLMRISIRSSLENISRSDLRRPQFWWSMRYRWWVVGFSQISIAFFVRYDFLSILSEVYRSYLLEIFSSCHQYPVGWVRLSMLSSIRSGERRSSYHVFLRRSFAKWMESLESEILKILCLSSWMKSAPEKSHKNLSESSNLVISLSRPRIILSSSLEISPSMPIILRDSMLSEMIYFSSICTRSEVLLSSKLWKNDVLLQRLSSWKNEPVWCSSKITSR